MERPIGKRRGTLIRNEIVKNRRKSWCNKDKYPAEIQKMLAEPLRLEDEHKYYLANREYLRIIKKGVKTQIRVEVLDRVTQNLDI